MLIKTWQPWKSATGPKSKAGKVIASRNSNQGLEWPALRTLRTLLRIHRSLSAQTSDKTI
jgi:hypothetical protein